MSEVFAAVEPLVDALIERVGKRIVLGLPVGIGKAVHVADALLDRARADPSLSLTIFTGLTLETPTAGSDLERRFLEPIALRLYGSWPTPKYATAIRDGSLPGNVAVHEFYLRPGGWLGNPLAQQSYSSVNYSQVTDTLLDLGVNVVAQLVSARDESPGRYSLGSNPEITLDLLPHFEARRHGGEAVAMVGQVNRQMPWMAGDAELDADVFDLVLDTGSDFPLFGMPARSVSAADYAAGMHVASLVPDGGTLQVGIGSLSEAVAHCLLLRHREPEVFAQVLERLPGGTRSPRRAALPVHTEPFEAGLFASTELLSDALLALFENGIVRRPAGPDDEAVIHAGFFVGSNAFYDKLRVLDEKDRRRIRLTRISEVNTLFGQEVRKRAERRDACFINETMMVTLMGAAVSDGLEDGRVVSGVGGQFDFVSMAQALDDARSILVCRARRFDNDRPRSNIRWNYGHMTVPRHYRDVFVSEYGIAATRGASDRRVIEAILGIADAAFQPDLARAAMAAGKLPAQFRLPDELRANTPARLDEVFSEPGLRDHFPRYPLGSDFTPVEQHLIDALAWLERNTARPSRRVATILAALVPGRAGRSPEAIERMELDAPAGFRERLTARLLNYALARTRQ